MIHNVAGLRTVLVLSPYFAPRGDIAGKRTTRFVRHLREHDWEPVVLTLPNGGASAVIDPDLRGVLPPGVRVEERWLPRRPGALLPQRLRPYVPCDAYFLGTAGAVRRAAALARETGAAAIYASSEPTSVAPAAVLLGALTGLPVLLDLRDPWTLEPMWFPRRPPAMRRVERALEAACFARAARVLLNTCAARRAYAELYPRQAGKLFVLRNGYDRDLFRDRAAPPTPAAAPGFELVHFGNLFRQRDLRPLLRALARVAATIRVVCYGTIRDQDLEEAARLGLADRLIERPPLPYRDALPVLAAAGALLVVQAPETPLQVPGKLYDYLVAGPPILAISANPEIDELVGRAGAGLSVRPDEAAIAAALERLAAGATFRRDDRYLAGFAAPAQTAALAAHLDAITRSAGRRPAAAAPRRRTGTASR